MSDEYVTSLECDECGGTAVEKPDGYWQQDEEVTCPECGHKYVVNMTEPDENGLAEEVWLEDFE